MYESHEFTPLKKCPFCGGEASLEVTKKGVFVMCSGCFVRTQPYRSLNKGIGCPEISLVDLSIREWNRRIDDEQQNQNESEE